MGFMKSLILLVAAVSVVHGACQDVDTSACQLLAKQRTDLCSDQYLANTTCPRFCGLCPVTCYACDDAILDPSNCTTTVECAQGQVCSMRELRASDGRHEYTFDCLDKKVCDGSGFNIAFGKREVETRDLSITCCEQDLCNMGMTTAVPATTALVLCPLDIIFLVDDGTSIGKTNFNKILSFIQDVVTGMNIGSNGVLVGLVTFDSHTHKEWDLNSHDTKNDLLQAIKHVDYDGGLVNTEYALHSIGEYLQRGDFDGRRGVQDVVVVISNGISTDTTGHHRPTWTHHVTNEQATALRQQGVKIVNVEIGHQLDVIHSHVDVNVPVTDYATLSSAVPQLNKAIANAACH